MEGALKVEEEAQSAEKTRGFQEKDQVKKPNALGIGGRTGGRRKKGTKTYRGVPATFPGQEVSGLGESNARTHIRER